MKERSNIFNHIEKVVKEKIAKGRYPFCCSFLDLKQRFPFIDDEVIKECMRELHRIGKFKAGLTINKIPLIIYDISKTNNTWSTSE